MASALLESLLGDGERNTSRSTTAAGSRAAARNAATVALLRDGLPGPRDEAWKYTHLRALEQRRYVDGDAAAQTRPIDASMFALPGMDGPRLVFVNGVFRADLSHRRAMTGLTLATLDECPDAFENALHDDAITDVAARAAAFLRLNVALLADGALLRLDAGVKFPESVHLVFIGAPAQGDIAWQMRLRVELGAGAALQLVEHHVGAGAHAHLGNLVADYTLGANARLDLVQIQDAAETAALIRRSAFRVERDARLSTHTLEVGAQTMRHDFNVELAGTGARFDSHGVFALHGRQHADTHLDVRHVARDTACDITWRGVADQRARGVFHGAIMIAAGADGADAQLSNKNLLLSPLAEIDTQPVLEIHADEVKAAHGATVGQLDEHALFYLRSRGIPAGAARRLLVSAFCGAMLAGIEPVALRERLHALLAKRLPAAAEV